MTYFRGRQHKVVNSIIFTKDFFKRKVNDVIWGTSEVPETIVRSITRINYTPARCAYLVLIDFLNAGNTSPKNNMWVTFLRVRQIVHANECMCASACVCHCEHTIVVIITIMIKIVTIKQRVWLLLFSVFRQNPIINIVGKNMNMMFNLYKVIFSLWLPFLFIFLFLIFG